jgi:hypothetical protein
MSHGAEKVYLNASIVFAALTAALFTGLGFTTNPQLAPILAILSGMTTMGALTSFQRFLDASHKTPVLRVSFNEDFLSTVIAKAYQKPADQEKKNETNLQALPWAISSDQLLGVDNALALAKLRMDIESELRRLAYGTSLSLPQHVAVNIRGLAKELTAAGSLPAQLLEPLSEVTNVCNRGIHGEEVSNELAASVLKVGNQLLEGLRLLPVK